MCASVSVVCPAVVYASMLSDLIGCTDIQEGFLLGASTDHTRTQISDTDINAQTCHTTIHISSYLSMDTLGALYDGCGRVRDATLADVDNFCSSNKLSVVGWYRWRSCGDPWDRVFCRERLVHQQLQEKFNLPGFLLLLFNWRRDSPDLLPSTSHLLVCLNHAKSLTRLALQLSNLGNTSNSNYKLDPGNPALYTSSAICSVLHQRLQNLEPGVQEATELHAVMEQTLQQQLALLGEAQQQHRNRVQQLHTLRSVCYLNHIVPDIEWPCAVGLEKGLEPKVLGTEISSATENAPKPSSQEDESPLTTSPAATEASAADAVKPQAAKSEPSKTSTRRTPVKKKPIAAKQAPSPGRANGADGDDKNAIDGLQRDLDKLAVRNGCEKKSVGVSKSSPARPLVRGTRGSPSKSRSPSVRGSTERTVGSRSSPAPKSAPGSAARIKKRLNSSSPGKDSPTRGGGGGGGDAPKLEWKL